MNGEHETPIPTRLSGPVPGTMNTNTYISIGLVVTVLGGFVAVINTLYSAKGEITARLDKVEWRMASVENKPLPVQRKESWTDRDMFKWAVRLQKENQGKITVPEPEMHEEQSP